MRKYMGLVGFIAIIQLTAFLSSYFITAMATGGWYREIVKSPLTPPDFVFPIVWPCLYVLIGISGWILWQRKAWQPFFIWLAQLVVNLGWSYVFFGLQAFDAALVMTLVIWAGIAATIITAWPYSRAAALLLLPYLAWVSFATHLAHTIWMNN